MRKIPLTLALGAMLTLSATSSHPVGEGKENIDYINQFAKLYSPKFEAKPVVVETTPTQVKVKVETLSVAKKQVEKKVVKVVKPKFELISDSLMSKFVKASKEFDVPLSLLLGMAKVESGFNPKAISETHDYGLLQINQSNISYFAKAAGIKNVDPLDAEDSIRMAAKHLSELYDLWSAQGYSEEDTYSVVMLAYNRGSAGAKRYIRNHDPSDNTYVKKVTKAKEEIEKLLYKDGRVT